jgi:archaellin
VQWDPFWTWASSSEYVNLTTQNDINIVDEFQVTFTCEVLNDSGDEIESATVIVSLYDLQTGKLVATGYVAIYEPINPNASAAYEVWINTPADFDISTVEYTIAAKGDLP